MNDVIIKVLMLPEEIQIKIFQYYYSYFHYDVINEIKNVFLLEKDIVNFIVENKKPLLHESNLKYYRKFNKLVKNISNDNGKMLLCKINNLKLKYSNLEYINNICYKMKEDYKYIAPILICIEDVNRYYIQYFLSSL